MLRDGKVAAEHAREIGSVKGLRQDYVFYIPHANRNFLNFERSIDFR